MDNLPKICVIGCGYWGQNLIRNMAALGHLYAVCDINQEVAANTAVKYPGVRVHATPEAVLEDASIDAIVLATPAEQHYRIGLQALRAGKDLFVEKPLALDWRQGSEMILAARREDRILMVGHLLHYHPAIVKTKELIRNGELGQIEYIYSNRLSMGKIRHAENALWSFAPHDVSVILSLVGQMPLQVTCTGGAYLQPNVADVTISNLLFDRGVRAHIFVSWLHPYKEQRLVIIGSKQMLVFEDTRPDNKLMLFSKEIKLNNGALHASKPAGTPVEFEVGEPLRLECQHFIDCVQERKQPLTPGEEGVDVLQVLQGCQHSLSINGEPVRVSDMRASVNAV